MLFLLHCVRMLCQPLQEPASDSSGGCCFRNQEYGGWFSSLHLTNHGHPRPELVPCTSAAVNGKLETNDNQTTWWHLHNRFKCNLLPVDSFTTMALSPGGMYRRGNVMDWTIQGQLRTIFSMTFSI